MSWTWYPLVSSSWYATNPTRTSQYMVHRVCVLVSDKGDYPLSFAHKVAEKRYLVAYSKFPFVLLRSCWVYRSLSKLQYLSNYWKLLLPIDKEVLCVRGTRGGRQPLEHISIWLWMISYGTSMKWSFTPQWLILQQPLPSRCPNTQL
jgi:hypothetical protein